MSRRAAVLDAFHAACARVDLRSRVRDALGEPSEPTVVIAAGKAASAMFSGVRGFGRALIVVPHGMIAPVRHDPRITYLWASHPLPDESSVRAAEAALALAASNEPGERVFLISGGASSLLCAPSPGIDLARKRAMVDALLHADASIAEINVVRRHLSRVKGGALARACGDHARRTLIVSDVIVGGAHDVGSGPTVRDPTTIEDAARIAARFGLGDLPWVETSKEEERFDVIAAPALFATLMREELARRGFPNAEVTMTEPVLRIPAHAGRGGRCTHAAALASLGLKPGELFAALATDGVDGNSETGGAIVEGPIEGAKEAIERFDTAALHVAAGTAVPSRVTGINFSDVHVRIFSPPTRMLGSPQ